MNEIIIFFFQFWPRTALDGIEVKLASKLRQLIFLIFWPQKGLFEFEAAVLTNLGGQNASIIVIFIYYEAEMATRINNSVLL